MTEDLYKITLKRYGGIVHWVVWRLVNDGRGWYSPYDNGGAFTKWGGARRARKIAPRAPVVDSVPTLR